ncbi:uncharacterized protein LOC127732621 [Mytilus californianus]|uniref:uncharacterized protein LOC127732621 n=1 Tax=Mytilus californianus TaxID=6549 RepID=UPI0022461EF6|nr:uncharacterized protein LOC127732621 [Mytilus californianus]
MSNMDRYGYALYLHFKIQMCILLCCNSHGKEFTGPNVCWKKINEQNIRYCCLTYYYDNGNCKACNPGSTSLDGITCVPCPPNTYGEICKYKCNCSLTQKCHRQYGCIDISSAVIMSSTEEYSYIHRLNATYRGFKRSESSTEISLSTGHTETEYTKKHKDANTTFIYYLVVAGGLVGWLVFCFAAVRLICKNIKRERPPRQLLSPPTEVSAVEMPLPVVPNESIYNEIEDEIEDGPSLYLAVCHSPSYLSVKDDSEKSLNSSTTENNSISEATVSPQKEEDLEYTDALSDNSQESFDECNANKNEDYLHPYTTLQVDKEYTCSYTN